MSFRALLEAATRPSIAGPIVAHGWILKGFVKFRSPFEKAPSRRRRRPIVGVARGNVFTARGVSHISVGTVRLCFWKEKTEQTAGRMASVVCLWCLWCLRLFNPDSHWTVTPPPPLPHSPTSTSIIHPSPTLHTLPQTPAAAAPLFLSVSLPLFAHPLHHTHTSTMSRTPLSAPAVIFSRWLNWVCILCSTETGVVGAAVGSSDGDQAIESDRMTKSRCEAVMEGGRRVEQIEAALMRNARPTDLPATWCLFLRLGLVPLSLSVNAHTFHPRLAAIWFAL